MFRTMILASRLSQWFTTDNSADRRLVDQLGFPSQTNLQEQNQTDGRSKSMYILLGCGMVVMCMAIQCVLVSLLLKGFYAFEKKHPIEASIPLISTFLFAALLVLLAGNLLQVSLCSWLLVAFGVFTGFGTSYYHFVVNFTTLGYGDMVMKDKFRIFGALEAANGVLMLGVTTSVLFSAVSGIMRRRRQWHENNHASPTGPGTRQETP